MIGGPLLQVASAVLVVADVAIRATRLVAYAREAGGRLTVRDSLITTIIGDAAAALTPWRLGGEPARVVAMRDGNTLSQSVVALAGESAVNYAAVAIAGAWLASRYASEWWDEVGSRLLPKLPSSIVGWTIACVALALAAAMIVVLVRSGHRIANALRAAFGSLLRASWQLLSVGFLLSLASLAARIALLPLLAADAPHRPELGVLALVSFSLLYGQLVIPTPSGAGAVEAAVLGGATGVEDGVGELLAKWRLYSTVLPAVAGVVVAFAHFGPSVWRGAFARFFSKS